MHPSEVASSAGTTASPTGYSLDDLMPVHGVMVEPFPEPGAKVRTAMEALQLASMEPPADEDALTALANMPRPWDPATCTGELRAEMWRWLEEVAAWINEQHLWNLARPGIPECWPAHPHLVHDLAVLACGRYYTLFAVTPAALEDWHRYALPGFLERVRDRLGDGCQPSQHQRDPRADRDRAYRLPGSRQRRAQRYRSDQQQAADSCGEGW